MEEENFSLEMRGYKKDEVDRVLAELRAELEHVRDYNYTASAELEQTKAELEAQKRKKSPSAPGYAELGAQFLSLIHISEPTRRS